MNYGRIKPFISKNRVLNFAQRLITKYIQEFDHLEIENIELRKDDIKLSLKINRLRSFNS